MIPYYLLVTLPVLIRLVSKKYRFTFEKRLVHETQAGSIDVFMILFLLLLALRGTEVGNDTRQYMRLFNEYSEQSIPYILSRYSYEYGYKLLNRLVGLAGGNFQMLLAVTATICTLPLWYFYKRESENQLLTLALFLSVAPFVMYFSGNRQSVAMSLGIPIWYCIREKKHFWLVVLVFLALQFHSSAFMLLALYPLYHARITKRWLWFVIPCMAVVYIFKGVIFNFLVRFLWDEFAAPEATGATTVLLLLILFGIYCYIIPDEKKMDRDTIALRNVLLLSITLQFFAMLHPLAMRMNYYFLIFVPILIPRIAARSKVQYKQIADLSVAIMTVYFFYYFISNGIKDNDALNIFPYIPFWK